MTNGQPSDTADELAADDPTPAPDAAVPDATMPDAAAPDTAVPDAAAPDAAAPDAAVPDLLDGSDTGRPVPSESQAPLVFLIAGEPSGDVLGARLMAALKRLTGGRIRFDGIGGPAMTAEGLRSRVPMADLARMGLVEILPHLRHLMGHIRATVDVILQLRPAVLVTIDSPGFTFRVARQVAGTGIPLVHYVAPTVWAWKPKRAERIARFLDRLLVLLPFEPPYFTRHGLPTDFVGHPVVESGLDAGDGARFRAHHDFPEDATVLCVLPGSRHGEIRRLLPVFRETVRQLANEWAGLRIVIPTVPLVARAVRQAVRHWPVPVVVVDSMAEKPDTYAASTLALAASGTVSLELALAGIPTVIAYRVNPVTAWLLHWLVHPKARWASLVNLLYQREVVPEYLQSRCTPQNLTRALNHLLRDPMARRRQITDSRAALDQLGAGRAPAPSEHAARAVLLAMGTAGRVDGTTSPDDAGEKRDSANGHGVPDATP